jgi:DNA polymerase-3 subunit epsilon
MRQIILDTETTGLSPTDGHRIIEIGCLEMINRRLTGKHFHHYINPEREIDKGAIAVHGITDEFLSAKPLFENIVDDFIAFTAGAELIIHNAPFDISFLDFELKKAEKKLGKKYGKIINNCQVFDTLPLARQLHPGQRNNLDALCKRYGVNNSRRDLHGALIDAELLAGVYLLMTGGQSSLFAEEIKESTIVKSVTQENTRVKVTRKLRVIKPTPVELTAHEERLNALRKKNANVIWDKTVS